MTRNGGHVPDTTPARPERSDATVDEAVDRAAADHGDAGTLRDPEHATPGSAPVEQVSGDDAMTRGRAAGVPAAGEGEWPRRASHPRRPPTVVERSPIPAPAHPTGRP
jgi:hypothetical protein